MLKSNKLHFEGFVINISGSDHSAAVRSVKIHYGYALYCFTLVVLITMIDDRPRTLKQQITLSSRLAVQLVGHKLKKNNFLKFISIKFTIIL